jgi:hypothetical protein
MESGNRRWDLWTCAEQPIGSRPPRHHDDLDCMMILDLDRNRSRYAISSSAFATGACLRRQSRSFPHRPQTHRLTLPTPPTLLTPKQHRHRPAVTTRDRSRITSRSLRIWQTPWRVRRDGEAPGLGAVTETLDRNLHPQRSCGSHFKINTFRAFSRSLLAPLCGVMSHLVTRSLGSMTRAVPHCVAEPRQGEKALNLSSGGGIDMLPRPVESARRGSPTTSK